MYGKMKVAGVSAGVALAACVLAPGVFADDAVGVMRVDAGTNGLVEADIPFAPMSDIGPLGYVSGLFCGDGGEFSDRLYRRDSATGEMTNAVWSASAWLDPATLLPSFMQALPGDTLYFVRTDAGQFDFSVFGRIPCAASPSSGPVFSSLCVDPADQAVSLCVSPSASPYDILASHGTNAADAAASAWRHLSRSGASGAVSFFDSLPPPGSASLYMVSDATRDTDGDGLSDALESRVYGTSPLLADTDGDGIPDGREVAWGSDPLSAGNAGSFSWFEGFERPSVVPGSLVGLGGWKASGGAGAVVREGGAFEGAASLDIHAPEESNADVSLGVSADAEELWLDMRLSIASRPELDAASEDAMAFAVTPCGIVATDGGSVRTNASVVVGGGAWTRFTCRLDYRTRRWDLYVDGVCVFDGLAMRGNAPRLSEMGFAGGEGGVDAVSLSTERPLGLSSDGDQLPDEWEFAAFGSLECDGSGDFDSDGLPDLAEFRAGSDPLSPDTDGDGIPDGWETLNGLDPLDPADAALDPDGDGLSNAVEFALGSDPVFFEPDPRLALPGIRAEFRFASGDLQDIPDFADLKPFAVCAAPDVDFADGRWPAPVEARADGFACRLSGFLLVPVSGPYTFYVTSDDGSRLVVDGTVVTSDPAPHAVRERSGSINLEAGWRPIEIHYYENKGDAVLSLAWSGPGFAKGAVPAEALRHLPENLPPALSLSVSPGPYVEWQTVRISVSAHDVDGDAVTVSLYDGEELLASTEGDVMELDVQLAPVGTHLFRAVAADGLGAAAESTVEVPVERSPAAYSPGVNCAYYAFASALSGLPDVSARTPVSTGVAQQISFPATVSAWEGAPAGLTNRYSAVFAGALMARESGMYTLSLRSDDGSRLWIDGAMVADNDGNHSMKTVSVSMPLSAGLHDLRVEYYENEGDAGLELSWTRPDGVSETVPQGCLFRTMGTVDSDSDGMPDWWEEMYSLDPSDPSDAALDPDGDVIPNLAEYLAGTSPRSSDTDSDGMPDAWEAANGLCPFADDSISDLDSDGLVNIEEFRFGADPSLADTDGDGASDYAEVRNTRGNPLVADIYWTPVAAGPTVAGASFTASTGTWRTEADGVAYAAERAGSLTWNLAVPEGGADALAVRVGQHNFYSKTDSFDLSLFVDGLFVARQVVSAPYGTSEDAYFFLPEIPAGEHEFRLVWHNWEVNTFLAVYDLRFVSFGGPDADGDGVADWKEHRADEATDVADLPLESLVSPLCMEGRDLWRDVLEVEVAYPETNAAFATVKTIGDGFYADIPLPANGSATISLRDRSLAGSFNVAWKPFDVFAEDYATNALVIRTGDALKIAPYEGAESEVSISVADGTNGWIAVTNWTESAATPYVFETEGLYLVSVAHDGLVFDDTAYALVEVVRSRFPKRNPAILMDAEQTLACPELSPRNLVEHDSELQLSAEVSGDGVKLLLLTHADRDLGLVSRLDDGGAISDAVQVTPVWADNGTYYRVAETYPDGSQLVEVSLLLGAVPEGTTVNLEIFVSGVTFDDGTRTKTLTAGDFDANGHITIRFIKARGVTTSVCHRTYIYQDGKLIYTNKEN